MDLAASATKPSVFESYLAQGMVMVTLDARAAGVDVPTHLHADLQLHLNLSYRFGLPFAFDAQGIRATLTFGGVPHQCVLPWPSIYLMFSHATGSSTLFLDDVPHELRSAALHIATQHDGAAAEESDPASIPPNTSPMLTVVGNAENALPKDAATTKPPEPRTPPRRGHLRLVK